jgi:transposase-like protein
MLYSESYKKQVVRKVLSNGVILTDVARKLNIARNTIDRWKKTYAAEVQVEVEEVDLSEILREEVVDVEALLRDAERKDLQERTGSAALARQVEELSASSKAPGAFNDRDKYAIVSVVRALGQDKRGAFLRSRGIDDRYIKLWEEELLDMSKGSVDRNEYVKKLEFENRLLKKQLADTQRDKHELEVIIELKKKHPRLFQSDTDEN